MATCSNNACVVYVSALWCRFSLWLTLLAILFQDCFLGKINFEYHFSTFVVFSSSVCTHENKPKWGRLTSLLHGYMCTTYAEPFWLRPVVRVPARSVSRRCSPIACSLPRAINTLRTFNFETKTGCWGSEAHSDWSLPVSAFFTGWMCRDFLYLPGALFHVETECADCWVICCIHSGYHSKRLSWRQFLWPEPARANYTLTFKNVILITDKMTRKSPAFCVNINPSSCPRTFCTEVQI